MYYQTTYPSPVGVLTLAADETDALAGLWIEGQKYHGSTIHEEMAEKDDIPIFDMAKRWLDRYFAGKNPEIAGLPLSPLGIGFRQRVWDILRGIPYGEVTTYGAIARHIALQTGKNVSAQAVGGAVGHNPISIIIPCHRVVGADGSLTGYAGGLDVKIKLLALEGVDMSRFYRPKKGTAL